MDSAFIEDDEVCSSRYGKKYNRTNMFCVSHFCSKTDKRKRKGEPLFLAESLEVLGLFSFGTTDCGRSPVIYTDITAFTSWIKSQERPESKDIPEATSTTSITTLLSLVTLLFILVICFLLVWKWMKAKKIRQRTMPSEEGVLGEESSQSQSFKRYISWIRGEIDTGWRNLENPDDVWEVPRHDIIIIELLGEGFFGQVWKCEAFRLKGLRKRTVVAIKTIKQVAYETERDALLAEIKVMKELEPHLNVISLLGCCSQKDPVLLIMEYVKGGTLLECLRKWRCERKNSSQASCSDVHFASNDVIIFSYQIASGMEFLSSKSIVHRDLAARNVLLDTERKSCKIADFGFARDTKTNLVYEKKSDGLLPIRWLALESLDDGIYTTKSDVWSFGILVWEIVTLGSTPYSGMSVADVMTSVRRGYRLEKPDHCKRELYNVMLNCWEAEPADRPTFSQLVQRFDKFLWNKTEYVRFSSFLGDNVTTVYYNVVNHSPGEKI